MNEERDFLFDNCKFFLVLTVVLRHIVTLGPDRYYWNFISLICFDMPAFCFISGYFHPQSRLNLFLLLYQYLFIQILCALFKFPNISNPEIFLPYWHLWYHFCLIVWRLVTPHTISVSKYLILLVIYLVSIGVGFDSSCPEVVSRCVCFYFYYLCGFHGPRRFYEHFSRVHYVIRCAIAVGVFGCMYVIVWLVFPSLDVHELSSLRFTTYSLTDPPHMYNFLYRMVGIPVMLLLSLCFFAVVPAVKIRFISYMGKNTIYPYLLHIVIVLRVDEFVRPLADGYKALYIIGFMAVCVLMMSKPVVFLLKFVLFPFPWVFKFGGCIRKCVASRLKHGASGEELESIMENEEGKSALSFDSPAQDSLITDPVSILPETTHSHSTPSLTVSSLPDSVPFPSVSSLPDSAHFPSVSSLPDSAHFPSVSSLPD